MRSMRVIAASAVALMLAVGIGASAPPASAGVRGCAWQPLTLLNGWQSEQSAFGTGDPSYCAEVDGMVYLSGSVAAPGGATSDVFAVLPPSDAPAHKDYLNVYTLNGTAGVLRIDPDGSLLAYLGSARQFTSLAGVSFPAAGNGQGLMPLLNGWQSAQGKFGTGDPAYFVSGGAVHLSGSVRRPAGPPPTYSSEWTFTILPPAAVPTDCFATNVFTYLANILPLNIDPSGTIEPPSAALTSLAGVSYPAAPATWQPLTLLNGTNLTSYGCQPLSYVIRSGVVYLTGFVAFAVGFNGEFAVLPPGARPAHTLYLTASQDGGLANPAYVTLRIDPDGGMHVFNGGSNPAGYILMAAGLSYHGGS